MVKYLSLCISAALLGACTTEYDGLSVQSTLDVWYQEPTDQVDILWVIDNSNSMGAEQDTLATGFQSFALELENTGTDFHLGVITTTFLYGDSDRGKLIGEPSYITPDDDYLRLFPERVKVGVDGDGKENDEDSQVAEDDEGNDFSGNNDFPSGNFVHNCNLSSFLNVCFFVMPSGTLI